MSCPATPEKPCMCRCHLTIRGDEAGYFEGYPLSSCDECEDGSKLAPTKLKEGKDE